MKISSLEEERLSRKKNLFYLDSCAALMDVEVEVASRVWEKHEQETNRICSQVASMIQARRSEK
jgi:hypothetical protein